MPNVSIVIPCFNGKELLKKHLPSLIKEVNIKEDEIIVVNDASTDGSGEFIKDTYPFINLIELKQNMGYSYASNMGILKSKYNLVCLMGTDVEVTEGFLKPLLRHFERKDVFAVCSLELPLSGTRPSYALPVVEFKFGIFWYKYQPISGPLKEATPVLFAQGACTVYDKQKFLLLGGHDTMFKPIYWEDMDLSFRAWKRGWQSLYEPESLHRHHSQTTISQKYTCKYIEIFHWKNRFLFTWKNIKSPLLLVQHFLFLPFELFLLPLFGKKEFTLGFIYALKQLPQVISKRFKRESGEIFTDTAIIRRFKVPVYQAA